MISTHSIIEENIKRYKRGDLIMPSDFRGKGSEAAIKKALSRLTKEGVIKRIGHGLYLLPIKDPVFGEVMPSTEEIAKALARKEKVRIVPAGNFALHKLGLTLQVPTNLVYLTDGNSRLIKVGRSIIKFKSTTNKKLSLRGELSSLIILALEEIGVEQITKPMEARLASLLKNEQPAALVHDMKLASASVYDYLLKLTNQ